MQVPSGYGPGLPVVIKSEELPLVRVSGEGRLDVVPDTAEVSLGITVRANQASAAYQQTADVINKVVQALSEMGIPKEQMQSEQISLQPIYEKERLIGYEGTAVLRVTLYDLSTVGPAIDRAVAAGANSVRGISFKVRDPSAYEATALSMAAQDAQHKAGVLAQSLGVWLGAVWRVEAEPSPGPIFPAMARAALAEAIQVLPGTIELTRRVNVDYMIRHG